MTTWSSCRWRGLSLRSRRSSSASHPRAGSKSSTFAPPAMACTSVVMDHVASRDREVETSSEADRSRLWIGDEGSRRAVVDLVGGPDPCPLAIRCDGLDEEAVRRLLLTDIDRAEHSVVVPGTDLGQRGDEAGPRGGLRP